MLPATGVVRTLRGMPCKETPPAMRTASRKQQRHFRTASPCCVTPSGSGSVFFVKQIKGQSKEDSSKKLNFVADTTLPAPHQHRQRVPRLRLAASPRRYSLPIYK